MAPSRNAPCPCGSGRKYKHCCLPRQQGDPAGLLPQASNGAGQHVGPAVKRALVALGVALLVAGVVGALRQPLDGLAAGLAVLMLVAAWFIVRSPPPSRGRDDGGATIDFGTRSGTDGAPTSRSRRRRGQ